jgi:hypothetical protein
LSHGALTPVAVRFITSGELVDMNAGDVGISIGVEEVGACAAILAGNPVAADGLYPWCGGRARVVAGALGRYRRLPFIIGIDMVTARGEPGFTQRPPGPRR